MLFKMMQYFAETLPVISFKNDVYFLHEVSEKVLSFQKVILFYDINHNTEPLSNTVFVCLKMLLATVI